MKFNIISDQWDRQPVDFSYNKDNIFNYIKELSEVAAYDLGISDDFTVNIVTGVKPESWGADGQLANFDPNGQKNVVNIFPDTTYDNMFNQLTEISEPYYDEDVFKKRLRNSISHEFRHAWQYNTEEGSKFVTETDEYRKKYPGSIVDGKIVSQQEKYMNEPIEIDARNYGENFASDDVYEAKLNAYQTKTRTASTTNTPSSNTPLDSLNKMLSKNAEKRFAKNHNFVFGNDYLNDETFRNTVNDFINNNQNVYDSIYDKIVNKVDVGTTEDSMRSFSNMLSFVSQKEGVSINEIQKRMLDAVGDNKDNLLKDFSTNKEVFEHLNLDSSIWTIQNNNKEVPGTKQTQNKILSREEQLKEIALKRQKTIDNYKKGREKLDKKLNKIVDKLETKAQDYVEPIEYTDINAPDSPVNIEDTYKYKHPFNRGDKQYRVKQNDPIEYTDLDAADSLIDINDPEITKKINELTEQERIRFEEEQNKEFTETMNRIYDDYNEESLRINKEFTEKKKGSTQKKANEPIQKKTTLTDFFTQEEIANFTNEEILEVARNGEEYNDIINLRNQARKDLHMDPIPEVENTGKNTEMNKTLKNDFRANKTEGTSNTNTKINDGGGQRKRRRAAGKKKTSSSNLKKRSIKARKIDGVKQAAASAIVNEAIDAAEETIEAATENTAKTIMEEQHYTRVNRKHPSQMTDSELANLSDDEFEELKVLANGNQKELNNWDARRKKGKAEKIYNDFYNSDSGYYHSNTENTNPYRYEMPNDEYKVNDNGEVEINKTGETREIEIDDNKTSRRKAMDGRTSRSFGEAADDVFSWMKKHKINALEIGFNLFGAIGDYKNARRSGHGVVSSLGKAAVSFAMGEMLGFWGTMGVAAFKGAGKLAIKGTELLYKENRRMNSAANKQAFGNAEFYDTQQLATMRQSGMEMAKMAQYNLQQTLMGNEATYLHR